MSEANKQKLHSAASRVKIGLEVFAHERVQLILGTA